MKLSESLLFALTFFIVMTPALAKNNSYLCVPEDAVGFSFDKATKKWRHANFIAERKYLLSKHSGEKRGWEVKVIGDSFGTGCERGFNEVGFIECNGLIDFTMNNRSLRYIIVHKYGYVVAEYSNHELFKEGSLTPYLEIGKCSPL